MRSGRTKLELDKANGKLLGVCAGIANHTGVDATIIRVGLVIATLMGGFPWTLLGYFVVAMVARPRRDGGYGRGRISSAEEARERMRSLDLRMQAIETYATSSNSRLAREIEELR